MSFSYLVAALIQSYTTITGKMRNQGPAEASSIQVVANSWDPIKLEAKLLPLVVVSVSSNLVLVTCGG